MRTPGWSELCVRLDALADSDVEDQVRVLWLLHRLCLHGAILTSAPTPTDSEVEGNESAAGVAFMRGLATFAFCNDGLCPLDTKELERVATLAPRGGWARVESTYFLSVGAAKLAHDPERLGYWLDRHRQQIACAEVDDHTRCKLLSRYYRVHAFVPQSAGDLAAMSADMDQAEALAGRMRRDTPGTLAEWRTLTGAINESRTKEALLLGKLEVAEQWARRAVAHSPSDPRAHLELGQVLVEQDRIEEALASYRLAVRYGPPGTDIAWFMAGQCLELLERPDEACNAYLSALDLDPLAISAAERLSEVCARVGSPDVTCWAQAQLTALRHRGAERADARDGVKPYQQYGGVLGQ